MTNAIRDKKVYQMAYKTKKRPERRLFACLLAERAAVESGFHFASENLMKSENNPI